MVQKKEKNKHFKGRKYFLYHERWKRTTFPCILLSHDVWNYYHPNDPILSHEVIHHRNRNPSDDRIENLQKMDDGEHKSFHNKGSYHTEVAKQKMRDNHADVSGENNPAWKGGIKNKDLYLGSGTIEKQRYYMYQNINSLGEIGSDGFIIQNRKEK